MIKVKRCDEPDKLVAVRDAQLAALRVLGRVPTSDDIHGYRIVAEDLWNSQYHKCCYCEARIPKLYNDVEHYRPKAEAIRQPGCNHTHGYWWLAFSWDNLLYSCPECNRTHKNSKFPLGRGSQPLMPESQPPGNETPLLIDPGSTTNPVEHIEFVYRGIGKSGGPSHWWARPRNGSLVGNETINVCGLNRLDLRETREDYYTTVVLPQCLAIKSAIASGDNLGLRSEWCRAIGLLSPRCEHVGLAYDVLRDFVPHNQLVSRIGVGWPAPNLVAI